MRANKKALFLTLILLAAILQPFLAIAPQVEGTSGGDLESPSNTINTVGEEIDWPIFWQKFKKYALWDLEWYDGFDWISVKEDLDVQLSYPQPNMSKINLVFDASHRGNYRLTFAINKLVRDYVEKMDKYRYELAYDEISIIFDWHDCADIPGLIFTHGIKDDLFWFRIRRDNIPLGAHVEIDPATVATSTSAYAVSYGFQRKSFYAEGRFWAFYSDGTNAGWETSADGVDWSGAFTSIGGCNRGWDFAIWFDGTYVHYVRFDRGSTRDLFYRRGTPVNDGTINWSAAEQMIHNGSLGDEYEYPCISVDSNGYAWIGAYFDHADDVPIVLKNANNDGTWALDFATELSAVDSNLWKACPVPLTAGKVYAIYAISGDKLLGKLYDGGWGAEEDDLADWFIETGHEFSAVAEGDDVHLVYNRDATNQIRHNIRAWGVGWNVNDLLVQDAVTVSCGPALSIETATGDLYCFWTNMDHVYYKQYVAGSWDAVPTDWIDESIDDINLDYLLSSFYMDYGGYIGMLHITSLIVPYIVRFAFLTVPLPPSALPYTTRISNFSIGADGVWTDYDLNALGVPKGRIAEIVCCNKNADFARIAGVRTDGSTLNRYIDLHEAEGLGVTTSTMFVKCNETTGLIECYSEIGADVDFYLLGYFNSTFDFTESNISLGQPSLAWADLDLTASGVPDDAVVQILMGNEADATDFFVGIRENDSALERGYTLDEAEADGWSTLSMIIQSDSGAVIEWKGGSVTDVSMWLLGWFSSNVNFTEGFTDYSPAVDNSWTSKTIAEAPANSVVAFALVHEDSGSETFCGLRREGSSFARMIKEHEAEGGSSTGFQACVILDADKKCEVYCEDASEAQFAYTGYFTIEVLPVKPNIPSLIVIYFNTTMAGELCSIYAEFFDTEGLYGYIFWNNATSAPGGVNSSFTSMTGTSNSTQENVILPSFGTLFGAKYYVNDTDGYWGRDTLAMFPTAQTDINVFMGAAGIFWIIGIILVPIVAYMVKRR